MAEAQKPRASRDGGVELFRCLLMFIIVLHHCCVHGPLTETWAARLLFAVTVPAVDGFVAISGWYGIRFSWWKALRLLGLFAFYSALFCCLSAGAWWAGLTPNPPHFTLSGGWFGPTYLALMALAPLLNAGIEALAREPKKLLSAWGLFALAITLDWANALNGGPIRILSAFSVSGWGSHTFGGLAFIYVTARTARLLGWDARLGRLRLPLLVGLLTALLLAVPVRAWVSGWHDGAQQTCIDVLENLGYNAPPIWLTAMAALLVFLAVRPPLWLTRAVCFLGPSMFGVYLFHESPLRGYLYQRPEAWLELQCPWLPTVAILMMCAGFTFAAGLCMDLARRGGMAAVRVLWGRFRPARG